MVSLGVEVQFCIILVKIIMIFWVIFDRRMTYGSFQRCFKLREVFQSIQKSNNELKKKLRKMSMADDTFHKLVSL